MENETGDTVDYKAGEEVFAIDVAFEPVVQRGMVGVRDSQTRGHGIDVHFETDPMNADSDTERRISMDPDQVVHPDADAVEVYRLLGLEHLLIPKDFEDRGDA